MKQAQILMCFCSCCWIKQMFPRQPPSFSPPRTQAGEICAFSAAWFCCPEPAAGLQTFLQTDFNLSRKSGFLMKLMLPEMCSFSFCPSCLSMPWCLPSHHGSLATRRPPASTKSEGQLFVWRIWLSSWGYLA